MTVDADVHLRAVSNRQSILVVAMTTTFSLLVIGSAVLVMVQPAPSHAERSSQQARRNDV